MGRGGWGVAWSSEWQRYVFPEKVLGDQRGEDLKAGWVSNWGVRSQGAGGWVGVRVVGLAGHGLSVRLGPVSSGAFRLGTLPEEGVSGPRRAGDGPGAVLQGTHALGGR